MLLVATPPLICRRHLSTHQRCVCFWNQQQLVSLWTRWYACVFLLAGPTLIPKVIELSVFYMLQESLFHIAEAHCFWNSPPVPGNLLPTIPSLPCHFFLLLWLVVCKYKLVPTRPTWVVLFWRCRVNSLSKLFHLHSASLPLSSAKNSEGCGAALRMVSGLVFLRIQEL